METSARRFTALASALAVTGAALAASGATVHAVPWPQLVSRAPAGGAASGISGEASISGDGQQVAFASDAADLVAGDTNGVSDVFLAEGPTRAIRRVSLRHDGSQAAARSLMPALSADGRWLAFRSDGALTAEPAPLGGLYLLDLEQGDLALILADTDAGRGRSDFPAISADGGVVAFETTVVPGSTTARGLPAVLAWQRSDRAVRVVSPPSADGAAREAAVSGDGALVAYASDASNIVPASGAGRRHVYVADLASGATELASRNTAGLPANNDSGEPTLSGDGALLAFTSLATDLVAKDVNGVTDIFLRDRAAAMTRAVTDVLPGDDVYHPGDSGEPVLSADGRRLAFTSKMYTLTPGDRNYNFDVYLLDVPSGALRRVSLRQDGVESQRASWAPALSADGNALAFTSTGGLAPEDANDQADVYLWATGPAPVDPAPTQPGGHHPTATSAPHGPSATPPHHHPTATSAPHGPSATPPHHDPTATAAPQHPTATSPHHDPTATSPHHPPTATHDPHHATATAAHHDPTATSAHHGPTPTTGHHDPTATPGPHHPTATAAHHHPTATPVHPPAPGALADLIGFASSSCGSSSIRLTVRNRGLADASSFVVRSTSGALVWHVVGVPAGESIDAGAQDGRAEPLRLDADNEVEESDESNNVVYPAVPGCEWLLLPILMNDR